MSIFRLLPPRARLAQVLRSLVSNLPGQMGSLLDAAPFAHGKEALLRLADTLDLGAWETTEEETGWMADQLLERWTMIADPILEPAVVVLAPEEVWVGAEMVEVPLELGAAGLEEDAEVSWEGPLRSPTVGTTAILAATPPEGSVKAMAVVRARVRGRRAGGTRCVLVAEARMRLRRPEVVASDEGKRIVVRDQCGEPAAGVNVEVEGRMYTTDSNGSFMAAKPLVPGTRFVVAGAEVISRQT